MASDSPGERSGPFDDRFSGIVRPLIGQLVKTARRILEGDDLAWEAVQEALLGLWLQDPPPQNPRTWLIRAVVLRSLQLGRSIRRRRKHETRASRERAEASDRDDPARRVLASEVREALSAALARLGPSHRDVLILHLIEELDYESIARRLGIPIGTVRSRLHRARRELRGVMGPQTKD
jgi:RNA polymerase sigma-70 factor, ECF subfamily